MDYGKNLDLKDIEYFCEFDQIWKTEQWRDIPNYEGIYQVSDLGRIKSLSRIILRRGKYPFISNDKICKLSIGKDGYYKISIYNNSTSKTHKPHQLIGICFLSHIPCGYKLVINHKNFIRTDNRKLNLEIVTQRDNANKKHLKSTSKYVGVNWDKTRNKWRVYIVINGFNKFLGRFYDELEASKAYQEALENHIKKANQL